MNTVINAPTSNSSKMLVPQLSAMMFLQFFVWGAWYVTLGIVMSNHGLVKAIGDAYSLGPIALTSERPESSLDLDTSKCAAFSKS